MDKDEEKEEFRDLIRSRNIKRLASVNSASTEPPIMICEDCGFEDCVCQE